MRKISLIDLCVIISIISMPLVVLDSLNIIEIPIILINLLFITLLGIMTYINYKNNKKIQMYIGILILSIFIIITII